MKLNNHKNINPQPSQMSDHDSETPIDAEIIAEVEVDLSQMDETDQSVINLTSYPTTDDYEEDDGSLEPLPQWLKQVLIPLSTPWGLGSLCLILGTNLTIVAVQLWTIYQTPQPQPSTKTNPDSSPVSLSIPKSLNIARQSPDTVILNALSTVAVPKPSQPSPRKAVQPSPSSQPSKPIVMNVNQPPSLTNAILPPSLQPQTPANYKMPTTPLKVPQTPRNKPPQSIPVSNIPRPVPSMTIAPPPPPLTNKINLDGQKPEKSQQNLAPNTLEFPAIPQQPVSEDEQVRQTIKQQLQMEENNQSNIPLGFSHKTRLERQNGVNEVSPEILPKQIKHLEQLQERQVLDAKE